MVNNKKIQITYVIIGILCLCYVLVRAAVVGITYDEAWTIDDFVRRDLMDILRYIPCDANNHLINTLLIKLFFSFGSKSLFIARLPNVLAFTLYLYFGYKITFNYLSSLIGISCYLLLLLNPFVIDFFSIARGYGLAIGFQLASIYFLIKYIKTYKSSSATVALIFGALAVISNFSMLNYWLVILCLINCIPLIFRKEFNFKNVLINSIWVAIPLVAIIYEPIRKLKENGSLYYGGDTGVYSDTLVSLAKYSLYTPNVDSNVFAALNIFIAVLSMSIFISFFYNRAFLSVKNALLVITFFCFLSIYLQHFLFGTLYVIDRGALFFYPLLIFTFCFSLNDFSKKWTATTIVVSCVAMFGLNFFNHANTYKTAIWYFDAHSREILKMLNEKGKEQNKKLKIDFSWPFQNSFRYYAEKNEYKFLDLIKKGQWDPINLEADYYIHLYQSLEKVGYDLHEQNVSFYKNDTVKIYKNEYTVIYSK